MYGPEDRNLNLYQNDPRFRIILVPYQESQGCCWARNLLQQKYNGEEYTLQLDSHHRFIKDWDQELIQMHDNLKSEGIEKPLLTSYAPKYCPATDPKGRGQQSLQLAFSQYEGAAIISKSQPIPSTCHKPIPAKFYSGHFCFGPGKFCLEVPHDPHLYFVGEEINIAVRAYTHGYDMFHPHKIIVWHNYSWEKRRRHSQDHKLWAQQDVKAKKRLEALFNSHRESTEDFGIYDLGNKRSWNDYKKFAKIQI